MLVLSRKSQERVMLKDRETGLEIVVTIIEVGSRRVRIGFDAPERVQIMREEILKEASHDV